jgi:hypothetical protein
MRTDPIFLRAGAFDSISIIQGRSIGPVETVWDVVGRSSCPVPCYDFKTHTRLPRLKTLERDVILWMVFGYYTEAELVDWYPSASFWTARGAVASETGARPGLPWPDPYFDSDAVSADV